MPTITIVYPLALIHMQSLKFKRILAPIVEFLSRYFLAFLWATRKLFFFFLAYCRHLGVDLYEKRSGSAESYSKIDELDAIVGNLSLSDLNRVLYRADPEERDDDNGGGVYVLPDTGALVYCGLQGQYRLNGQVQL